MDNELKLCSDGEFLPTSLPCPPPNSGPYYYYPYDNLPLPPEEGINTDYSVPSSSKGGGASISSGAVAAIIITGGFTFFVLCLIALKCRARFILGYGRNARNPDDQLEGDQFLVSSGDNMVLNIVGCGLEERLVNLLPVYQYVGLIEGGKVDGKERQECAVCLSLFEEKETVRVLPKCHHVFHIHCIDKWFESHANCPLCRERITLQTIQLSLKYSTKPDHDQQPLDPALTPPQSLAHDHDRSDQHSFNDQHDNSSSSRDFCVQIDHQRLAGELQHPHSHQDISIALPSAALNITKAADQPGDTHEAGGYLAEDDHNSAGFTHRVQGHCDHKVDPSVPAVIPAEFLQDAESEQDKNAFKETAARDASAPLLYSDDDAQSAGPPSAACGLQSFYKRLNPLAATDRAHAGADRAHTGASAHQSNQHEADDLQASQGKKESSCRTGECFHPMLQASAGDHSTAPTNFDHVEQQTSHDFDRALVVINSNTNCASSSSYTRQCSPLRKSLSTGSMDIESNGKASTHPLEYAPARLARSSTRLFL